MKPSDEHVADDRIPRSLDPAATRREAWLDDESLAASLDRAVAVLRAGGLVAIPTETVYGLGADAANPEAVRRIFAAKGRPADHPLITHLASIDHLTTWARDIPDYAWRLAERFWPGPLTLILPRQSQVSDVVTGGLDSVGLRVPGHLVALELLRRFGGGVAAPSANRFGRVSPTCAAHVREELGDRVDWILDAGRCQVGLESTIVDATGDSPRILRPGGVTAEEIENLLSLRLVEAGDDAPRAPGRMASHYAPETRVELVAPGEMVERLRAALERHARVAVMAPEAPYADAIWRRWMESGRVVYVPTSADLQEMARTLYERLREIDQGACEVVLVELPDSTGLGTAILDRLRKAAGLG